MYLAGQESSASSWEVGGSGSGRRGKRSLAFIESLLWSVKGALLNCYLLAWNEKLVLLDTLLKHSSRSIAHKNNKGNINGKNATSYAL